MKRGISPIASLCCLAAAYEGVGANRAQFSFTGPSCSQFCPEIRCHSKRRRQAKNLNDAIGY